MVLGEHSTSGAGRILQVNLLTGEEVEDATTLDHAVKQSVVLPYTDSTFRHPVLVLDATNQGHIVPDTQENRFVGPSSLRLPDLQLRRPGAKRLTFHAQEPGGCECRQDPHLPGRQGEGQRRGLRH